MTKSIEAVKQTNGLWTVTTVETTVEKDVLCTFKDKNEHIPTPPVITPIPKNYINEDFELPLTGTIELDKTCSIVPGIGFKGGAALVKSITAGQTNTWQTAIKLPMDIMEGGELWMRTYIFVPVDFDWTCRPIMKLLRWAVVGKSGEKSGYISILTTRPGNYSCTGKDSYGYMVMSDEAYTPPPRSPGGPQYICQIGDNDGFLTPGLWHCVEMYAKVGSNNNGALRAWHNGKLIFETKNISTVPVGGKIFKGDGNYTGHIVGYWNGGVPKNQSLYFDSFTFSFSTPLMKDTNGNPMIGPI